MLYDIVSLKEQSWIWHVSSLFVYIPVPHFSNC